MLILFFLISTVRSQSIVLTPTVVTTRSCTTKENTTGICVNFSYCNEKHEIEPGGNIGDYDLRISDSCGQLNWCCSDRKLIQPSVVTNKNECFARDGDFCPSCVSLYRSGGNDSSQAELFCAGVLIGSKVVLSAATCLIVAAYQNIWAKLPHSSAPGHLYKIELRKQHEKYNSGTHEYDLAIFILSEEVKWNDGRKEACLAITSAFQPHCFSFGFNANDKLISTLLQIDKGSCTPGFGETVDGSCGKSMDEDPCLVSTGAPVICQQRSQKMTVHGIARSPCQSSGAQLGAIIYATPWLTKELNSLNLTESNYVLKF